MSRIRRSRPVEEGDGRLLEPYRWWHLVRGRSLFFIAIEHAGGRVDYALDVRQSGRLSGDFGMAYVYRNSRQQWKAELPARFPVRGGVIEVAYGGAGLKRAHYVTASGESTPLSAHPGSAIGRRLRFARTHPRTSTVIGAVSVIVLLLGVGLNALQVLEPVLQIPPIVETFGRFESPVHLPLWLNITVAVAAGFAAWERALRIRYNWLLDGIGT